VRKNSFRSFWKNQVRSMLEWGKKKKKKKKKKNLKGGRGYQDVFLWVPVQFSIELP